MIEYVTSPSLRVEHGSARSIDAVFREHHAFVRRMVRRWGVREPGIEDAVQDVFLVVTRRLNALRDAEKIRPWLVSICRRVASNHRRTGVRKLFRLGVLRREPTPRTYEDPTVDLVDSLLDKLSDSQREVFMLVEFEGWTAPEVAEALSISPNTVYSRLRLAKQNMRAHYAKEAG